MARDDQADGGIGNEAGKGGGYGQVDPAELHPGSDVDSKGARRSDGMTGSGPNTSDEFHSGEEERSTGTPAEERRD